MKAHYQLSKKIGYRAQAIVEFAIALPILLMMLFGILEVGRLIYIYSVVTNASRDGARYASAVGLDDSGLYRKYQYCAGIENAARHFAYFIPLTITIAYDKGPSTAPYDTCISTDGTGSDTIAVSPGDRMLVTVSTTYSPLVKLIPISPRMIDASSARTILGDVDLATGQSSIPSGGGSVPGGGSGTGSGGSGSSSTPTNTPTDTVTATNTPTATATKPGNRPTAVPSNTPVPTDAGPWYTLTPIPSSTSTNTPTSTATATATSTPTVASTAVTACASISVSSQGITIPGASGNKSMSMTFTNPNPYLVTVQNIQVTWNSSTGGPGNPGSSLFLQSASLGSTFWTWTGGGKGAPGPSITITPSTTLTIPGNGTASTITFTFDTNYQHKAGESITINLSTPGCENTPIKSP